MKFDIEIEGQGFYSITGTSKRGKAWINQNVQGAASGAACSDDVNMAADIADGAFSDGLNVAVRGYLYIGAGRVDPTVKVA